MIAIMRLELSVVALRERAARATDAKVWRPLQAIAVFLRGGRGVMRPRPARCA